MISRSDEQPASGPYLSDVEGFPFPDIFAGNWRGKRVVYCCAYGAPRTVEIIHLFSLLGAKLAIQIGSCGGLQSHLKTGDIFLPTVAIARDGVANLYGAIEGAHSDEYWLEKAEAALLDRDLNAHRGPHLTWSSIFAQGIHLINTWHRAGYLSVDMETATTFATAAYFQVPALSLLAVWDDLTRGRTFLDPLSRRANRLGSSQSGSL